MEYNSTYDILKGIIEEFCGEYGGKYNSKYEMALKILASVEDYEISEYAHKDPKYVTMNLYINGDSRYYTFTGNFSDGDYLEGEIKINGIIPGGQFKAFTIGGEIAAILVGNNYSGQSISLIKSGDRYISK